MPLYMKVLIAVLVVAAVETAWLARWELLAAPTEERPVAYQLDRWTGAVYVVGSPADGRVRLQDK